MSAKLPTGEQGHGGRLCVVCGEFQAVNAFTPACIEHEPVWRMCWGSVHDALVQIKTAGMATLLIALEVEEKRFARRSLLRALRGEIKRRSRVPKRSRR